MSIAVTWWRCLTGRRPVQRTRAKVGLRAFAACDGGSAMRQSVMAGAPPLSGSPGRTSGDSGPDGSVTMRDVERLTEARQPVATDPGGGVRGAAIALMPVWSWT